MLTPEPDPVAPHLGVVDDRRLMIAATTVSQIGWWGALVIGFVNAST